jgi:hypothetical protein
MEEVWATLSPENAYGVIVRRVGVIICKKRRIEFQGTGNREQGIGNRE